MAVELWTGLMCFGSASRGELRRFWLGLFRCATASHGVAVLVGVRCAVSVGLGAWCGVPVGHGGAGYGGRGTVRSGSVRRGEVGSVKAGRGGYGVERLL
jgi:hypothetical protein